jgi:hypothetical protein
VTSTLHRKSTGSGEPPGPWHRWAGIATVLGTVIGGLGLIVALLAWLVPRQDKPAPSPTAAQTNGSAQRTTAASTPAPASSAVFLDAGDFRPESGVDHLTGLPRPIKDKDGYRDHPLAIRCPSNQAGNLSSDVTFLLRGRYLQFDATVHPYYPAGADQQSVTYVTVLTDTRQVDNTLTTDEVASETHAAPNAPKPVSAAVDKAEKVTLRVRCEDPAGTIVLTGARVTPE